MAITVTHSKTNTVTDWTQAQLDAQIALGNFAPGTLLADIVLPSDWNDSHIVTGGVDSVNGQTGAVVLASDPNLTILGTGVAGDEFRYNEVVEIQSNPSYLLQDTDKYKVFTTDGSTNCTYDFSSVSPEFTCRFVVAPRSPARITLVPLGSIYIGNNEATLDTYSETPASALTVRILSNRVSCESVSGLWRGL